MEANQRTFTPYPRAPEFVIYSATATHALAAPLPVQKTAALLAVAAAATAKRSSATPPHVHEAKLRASAK